MEKELGSIDRFKFGSIGLEPVTNDWGSSRGRPVDRYYIEKFLEQNAMEIKGHVVEVGDAGYTKRFGGAKVTKSDVWDVNSDNSAATIVADLSEAPQVPSNSFDCFVLTQVLVLIRDVRAALSELYRVLRPGGVALISVPGISQTATKPAVADTWWWSFYPRALRSLLLDAGFEKEPLRVDGWGNLKTTVAFLAQVAQSDLKKADFEYHDERYPLIVTARARKPLI